MQSRRSPGHPGGGSTLHDGVSGNPRYTVNPTQQGWGLTVCVGRGGGLSDIGSIPSLGFWRTRLCVICIIQVSCMWVRVQETLCEYKVATRKLLQTKFQVRHCYRTSERVSEKKKEENEETKKVRTQYHMVGWHVVLVPDVDYLCTECVIFQRVSIKINQPDKDLSKYVDLMWFASFPNTMAWGGRGWWGGGLKDESLNHLEARKTEV